MIQLTNLFARVLTLLAFIFCTDVHAKDGGQGDDHAKNAAIGASAEREFTLKVLPLLKDKCLGCHGSDRGDLKGEFSVRSRDDLLKGGESEEPAIVPGEPDAGTLVEAISWDGLEMPPKENDRLNAEQIKVVRRWIQQGAPWPDEATQQRFRDEASDDLVTDEGMIVPTSGGTSPQWTKRRYQPDDLWAIAKVRSREELLPENIDISDTQAIDYFINAKLSAAGLKMAEKASPRSLIRRATFDLTGLPPSPDEIKVFENEYRKDPQSAWAELIDRLLASPRYGEHWGRHWLDVTRYADTAGMSNDYERSNMWRYRDYVIRSFNDDKPYNDFVIEQLAGDELADQSVRQRKEKEPGYVHKTQIDGDYTDQEAEWIVATGFLRLGPWDNAMVDQSEARQMYLDDLVNITGQTFLSTTMRCCKCHDHKFDPIPTRDYYRLYAAFATTHMAERKVPLIPSESRDGFEQGKQHVQRMLDYAVAEKNKLIDKRESAARAWFEEHGLEYKDEKSRRSLPDEEKPARHVGLNYVEQGQLKVREQDEWIWNRRLERYQPMAQSVFTTDVLDPASDGARKLRIDRKTKSTSPLENHILLGGALTALGDRVLPGVLSAVSLAVNPSRDDPYQLPESVSGRRLALARWIANADNSLATRSIVNRVWQYHFGIGLAANANNFGAKGAKPTHPALLDFLASNFVENDWRLKRLHRMIMLSDAYQQSNRPADSIRVAQVDPSHSLLSSFPRRRLNAEEIRDAILCATGEMTHCNGGLPIMPEINMEVALQPRMIQFSLAPAYQPSPTTRQRHRRSVYAYQVRGQADPFTELFNQPNPNESCELRESASVTPQVFTFLNSDMMTDRSIALAERLEREVDDLPGRIQLAFQLTLGRDPQSDELKQLETYFVETNAYHQNVQPEPVTYPIKIIRSLVEEFTGQPFEYEEILPVFENYQADRKPNEVSTETRALADLCLLLLNTNEFLYVD